MMEGCKEKYELLDDDSDTEEYDKSKEALMRSLDGKTYIRRPRNKSAFLQPQWLCQTVFIVLLVAAQVALSFFFLRTYWDLEAVKHKHSDIFRSGAPHGNNASSEEQLDYGLNSTNFSGYDDPNAGVSLTGNTSLLPRVKQLENKVTFLELILSLKSNEEKALQSQHTNDKTKLLEEAKIRALERQLHNVTEALMTLQKRLEEGLDNTLLQISQLKDDFYFLENALNITERAHFNSFETSTARPFKEGKNSATTLHPPAEATDEDVSPQENVTAFQSTKTKKTAKPENKIKIPFIKSHADFQVFFYGADKDASGYLTYAELLKVLGEDAPKEAELREFDKDGNEMYTYLELMKAFTLTD
ncbi:EF-hand calcium-binding domain-containing protein 14-like isoform X1 [Ambystoma mexicanum]|uniref:EF-hand calcium-binding domain-containing protein 14-like isoform X1 n=1 Tax=Ambystoma mexicanum TaxID=8296 RepID=UPI0037E979EE